MKQKKQKLPGRPLKEGFEYFPLQCDFFENDKIKALRRAHGEVGILTYLNILSRIYRTHGYYYGRIDLDVLSRDIAEQIANDRIRRVTACVRETINYLIGHEILDRGLAEQGIISGIAMQEKYIEMAYRAHRKLKMDIHVLVDVQLVIQKIRDSSEENPIISEEIPVNSEIMQQSKSKSESETTTTTPVSIAHARMKEANLETGLEYHPPDLYEVAGFLRDILELSHRQSVDEAERFIIYNEKRSWDCLPDWKSAARLWGTRVNVDFDS